MKARQGPPAAVSRVQLCQHHLLSAALALRSAKPIAETLRDGHSADVAKVYYEIEDALSIITQSMRSLDPALAQVLEVMK